MVVSDAGELVNAHVLYASDTLTVLTPGAPGGIDLYCAVSGDASQEGIRGPVRFMACTPRPRARITLLGTSMLRSTRVARVWTLAQFARARPPAPHAPGTRVRYDDELRPHVFPRHRRFREADFVRTAPIDHCYVQCDLEWIPPEWFRIES